MLEVLHLRFLALKLVFSSCRRPWGITNRIHFPSQRNLDSLRILVSIWTRSTTFPTPNLHLWVVFGRPKSSFRSTMSHSWKVLADWGILTEPFSMIISSQVGYSGFSASAMLTLVRRAYKSKVLRFWTNRTWQHLVKILNTRGDI